MVLKEYSMNLTQEEMTTVLRMLSAKQATTAMRKKMEKR